MSHCINADTNANVENGSEPIICVNICVAMDTMLNSGGDADTDVKCEQALKH